MIKRIFVFICLYIYIYVNFCAATDIQWTFDISASVAKPTDNLNAKLWVKNNNDVCDIRCSYQLYRGSHVIVSWTYLGHLKEHGEQTEYINIPAPNTVGSIIYTLELYCYDSAQFWPCDSSVQDRKQDSVSYQTSAPEISISVNPSSVSLDSCMTSTTVVVTVRNNGDYIVNCQYKGYDTNWYDMGSIYPGGSAQSSSIKITADVARSMNTYSIDVKCTDSYGSSSTDSTSVTIIYQPHPADAAIEEARNMINDAYNEISKAENEINKASNLGADTTSAYSYLTQAKSYITSANTDYNTAKSSYASTSCDQALTQAQSAKYYAQQAKTYATYAYNAANEAISEIEKEKTEASNRIISAQNKINEAQTSIDRADSIINNATTILTAIFGEGKWERSTTLGMDAIQAEADVESAKAELDNAKQYLSMANTEFNKGNYEMVRDNCDSAIDNALTAKNIADRAYNSLYSTVQRANVAYNEMSSAMKEIQTTNRIYNAMSEVVRSAKEHTNLSSVEAIINECKSMIDEGEDYYSQAQNKFSAGYYEDSVDLAIKARDAVAEAHNRLDRVVENLRVTVEDTLDRKYSEIESEIQAARDKINEASNTYASNGDEISVAQNFIQKAEIALKEAKSMISNVKQITDFNEFPTAAANAFEKLNQAASLTIEARNHAQSAINWGYATVGGAVLAAVGGAGAGFMYWRRKGETAIKTKKDNLVKEKPTKKKTVDKGLSIEKIATKHIKTKDVLFCPKCKKEVDDSSANFCEECGSKLEKKKIENACPVCGKEVSSSDNFCENCGAKLRE